uniref:Interferon alpha/beta receptor 2-like n=2 Tax=Nothobranchius TaxID=28779 RepID=A0A8C6LX17_NOTFU
MKPAWFCPHPTGFCVLLPSPANVSISSYNLQHFLSFWPSPGTPHGAHFMVQILSSRRTRWTSVSDCVDLKPGQTCNLTSDFMDPLDHYRARVRAISTNQTSKWTVSRQFQPLSDTVLGPPDLSLSGCGSCLVLRVRLPTDKLLWHNTQVTSMYWEVLIHVHRTRDGAELKLKLPYKQESVIPYLEPGVEYCVSVSITTTFNPTSIFSERRCSFTSPPPSEISQFLLLGLCGVFGLVVFLLLGRLIRIHVRRFKPATCTA